MTEQSSSNQPTVRAQQVTYSVHTSLPDASAAAPATLPPPPGRAAARRERGSGRRQGSGIGDWTWVIVGLAMFGVILLIGMSAFLILSASASEVEIVPTAAMVGVLPTAVVSHSDYNDELGLGGELLLADGTSIALKPWDGQGRLNLVLAGLDRRPGESGLTYRTDTIMILSVNSVSGEIGILSVPRDLYVQVPGYSSLQRINSPMVLGELQRAGAGPELLMKTIQLNFGIPIHGYVVVDFQAFIDLVDTIGGITVRTATTINDPQYPSMAYGYDPFYLPAGEHHLDGYDALRFARTRHGDSDINRAQRQQETVYAIRDAILAGNAIPQLLLQAPALWVSWQENVFTNLGLEEAIQLGLYVRDIPLDRIQMNVVDYNYLQSYTTPRGEAVLIPNRSRLGELMASTFGPDYGQ
jgi:polyisoprenyl-teichoic acid--peptidoglycan teichoic acid transferase